MRKTTLQNWTDSVLKRFLAGIAAIALITSLLWLRATPVSANPAKPPLVQTQLVSEVKAIKPGTPFWVALQMKISPKWHTYWINPGDSGTAPKIDWRLPKGFKAGKIAWPYPRRLPFGPLVNFGYEDEVYLLTQITPPANLPGNNPVLLQGQADWLVCKEDCIPESAPISLTLPVTQNTPPKDEKWAGTFAKTRQELPKASPWKVTATANDKELALQVNIAGLRSGQVEEVNFFPYKDGIINNAAPQKASFTENGLTLRLERGYETKLSNAEGLITIREKLDNSSVTQAFAIKAKIGATAPTAAKTAENIPLWQVLFFALLGGLILNLMPCVFPVLSLKALSIAQKSQQNSQEARMSGIVFTAGVLVSFAVLAGVLLGLRAVGQQIGWGFQLQSPIFVLLMAYVLFAVGLSLSGVYIVGASVMGIGQNLATKSGYVGEFFTGVFATIMATPCTAPFMATAIGVALTQPTFVAVSILLVLGFGLALPYLILCFTPALRRRLPKPGAWMETFQQFLAFPIYGATAWLVWVLTQQTGADGLAAVLTGFILIAFGAWLYQKAQTLRKFWRKVGVFGAAFAIALALTLTPLASKSPVPTPGTQKSAWQPYSIQRLTELRQSGKPVFVNFSAAWCITCLVNERVALSQPEVMEAFRAKDVALMKGDWTNRDADITQALSNFGRSGVPLYVLYSKSGAQEPIVLPQVLTPDIVRNALKQA